MTTRACRLAYGPADATATHCLLLQYNSDWFYLSATGGEPWVCWSLTFGEFGDNKSMVIEQLVL